MIVLIVDDDVDDIEFFTDAVAEIDVHVECWKAFNGIEALKLLGSTDTRPDYIFLDLNMPRMDGRQCLRHLKDSPVFHAIPVYIYSTSRRPEDVEELIGFGAAAFIVKPNKFQLLKNAISAILKPGFAARQPH